MSAFRLHRYRIANMHHPKFFDISLQMTLRVVKSAYRCQFGDANMHMYYVTLRNSTKMWRISTTFDALYS